MTRMRIETLPVRDQMRHLVKAILSAVRRRDWVDAVEQDNQLKTREEELVKIETECAKKDEEAKAKSAAAKAKYSKRAS